MGSEPSAALTTPGIDAATIRCDDRNTFHGSAESMTSDLSPAVASPPDPPTAPLAATAGNLAKPVTTTGRASSGTTLHVASSTSSGSSGSNVHQLMIDLLLKDLKP